MLHIHSTFELFWTLAPEQPSLIPVVPKTFHGAGSTSFHHGYDNGNMRTRSLDAAKRNQGRFEI